MNRTPTLRVQWEVWDEELPAVTRKVYGRTVTVRPRIISVHSAKTDLSDISVYIEGPTIKANGENGQHRRTHSFHANSTFDWPSLDELPAWAREYLEYARAVLSGANHSPSSRTGRET